MISSHKKIRVAFVGGGTGGHVYPLLAVAAAMQDEARTAGTTLEAHYFGANDRYRKEIEAQGLKFHSLLGSKLRRYASFATIIDIPKFFLSIIQALLKLYTLMPDVIFSKGGPGAFAIVLVGWFYKIPIVIHESDSVPGLTTKLSAFFAKKIAISFEASASYFNPKKIALTGNPIRPTLLVNRLPADEAKRQLGFDPLKPLLFVTGGSQGAMKLNEFVILNLDSLLPATQILHQTGAENFMDMKKLSEAALVQLPPALSTQSRYEPLGYLDIDQTRTALCAADVVLARAGASSIFEAAAFGKPLILVPLPSAASDHQRENAQAFYQAGGGLVIEESNLTISIFMNELRRLLTDTNAAQVMSKAALNFAKPDAARTIALGVLQYA